MNRQVMHHYMVTATRRRRLAMARTLNAWQRRSYRFKEFDGRTKPVRHSER